MIWRIALCLAASVSAGCSSRPSYPGPDREFIPLSEYAGRARRPDHIPPVVHVPAGARIQLRITSKPAPESHRLIRFEGPFEQVEDMLVSVRVRKTLQLDMKSLDCWIEGKWHGPLTFISFMSQESGLTLTDVSGTEIRLPVNSTSFISAELP